MHRRYILFSYKQNTKRSGTAVAGYGTAGLVPINIFKEIAMLLHSVCDSIQAILRNRCPGDKQRAVFQIVTIGKTVLYIRSQALCIVAAVLLNHSHLSILNLDTGLQIQKVCAQRCGAGATTTLNHILQSVQQEACFHAACKI